MIEVEVLYADLSRKRVQLDQIASVSKAGILAIVIQTDEEIGKKRNIVWSSGFDHYALCQKKDNGQEHIMLFGWDDGDFTWRRVTNPHDNDAKEKVDMPIGCFNVIFHGENIPVKKWETALEILNKEIL